jgi:hypothetical protein
MQELGTLVAQLGQTKKTDRSRRKSQMLATKRAPEDRQWRSGLCLQEVENQMMPTIAEDKYYPRRTMGADDMDEILEDADGNSPDIGPPPVSRFETDGPIAFDPNPLSEEQMDEPVEESEPALSINLETRKKRRESGPKLNIRRVSVFESPPEEAKEGAKEATNERTGKLVRVGAKRKFNVQEDEDKHDKADVFNFSRRNDADGPESDVPGEEQRASSPGRPVLSSSKLCLSLHARFQLTLAEPVNTDPVLSPKKQRSSAPEKEKPQKRSLPGARSRGRLAITRTITPPEVPTLPPHEPISTVDINLDSLPPKTPAPDAILSPSSTEPSTTRAESKDTPPPADLSSADQTGQAGRPSRRARPQVSYKEPSLAVKMRRPDAKLADAIVPHNDRRTSVESQSAPLTAGRVTIKRETGEEASWKPVSAPAKAGEEEAELGSPLKQKLDRRETGQDSKNASPSESVQLGSSTASKAISALINETSTARRRTTETTTTKESTESKEKDNLAIFDFNDSSPAELAANPRSRITDLAKAARNARRHSSVPTPTDADETEKAPTLPAAHKRTGSGTAKTTGIANLAKSTSAARLSAKEKEKDKKTAAEEEKSATSALRAERIASRRKSMLL